MTEKSGEKGFSLVSTKLLSVCWLLCIAAAYIGPNIIKFEVSGIGTVFLFRILLPIVVLLFLISVLKKQNTLFEKTKLEYCCLAIIAVFLLYGGISLFRALDFSFTFKRLFNLCFDMCFFYLALRLLHDKKLTEKTVYVVFAFIVLVSVLAFYEVANGGLFNDLYDGYLKNTWFSGRYQWPIVFYSNTNDLAMTLVFSLGIVYSFILAGKEIKAAHMAVYVISTAATYAVTVACSARLCMIAFYVLLGGSVLVLLCRKVKNIKLIAIVLVLCFSVQFANQYRVIVPSVKQFVSEHFGDDAHSQQGDGNNTGDDDTGTDDDSMSSGNVKDHNKKNDISLYDQFIDDGQLNRTSSAGIRTSMLIHTFKCFMKTYGFGMGLGNTEVTSAELGLTKNGNLMTAIHCFIARVFADYGVFILLPVLAAAVIFLSKWIKKIKFSLRKKSRADTAYCVFVFIFAAAFPIISTASADSQDSILMWLYLAFLLVPVYDWICDTGKTHSEMEE